MAATGFTPISLYYTTTASAVPTAGNLVAGELALNNNDGKLFYKDSSGVVQTIASKAGNINVSSFSGGTTGLTPNTATTGAITLAGTLAVANGGTGVTTSTGSVNNVLSTSPTLTTPIISTTLGVGGTTPSSSGAGISFPATQSASTDANTLDDYEEGAWTPNIGGTATYTTQKGTYVKVGRMVTCNFRITINLLLTGSTTSLYGFPFTASNDSYGDIYSGTCSYFSPIAANTSCLTNYIASSTSYINFVGQNAFDNACVNTIALFGNSTDVAGSITYFV